SPKSPTAVLFDDTLEGFPFVTVNTEEYHFERLAHEKMAEFLREAYRKDTEWMLQLKILGRETELRACEKDLFIKKLKGVVKF
ncbi:hypothetical protein Tco_1147472, partial [Tanacetum coccineum]